jgi:hypothetical protein
MLEEKREVLLSKEIEPKQLVNRLRPRRILNRKKRRKIIQDINNILIRKFERKKNKYILKRNEQERFKSYGEISYHSSNQ